MGNSVQDFSWIVEFCITSQIDNISETALLFRIYVSATDAFIKL
ncbi:hypothetical protein CSB66_2973 [Enterobacter hormaechei]|nr:hypothetical protein T636_A1032 [Enterobacter hormaechei subsp. xiangfangensis]RAL72566.1 hypothetical protein CSC35_1025 [Enterobacter hormaechei]RCG82144.1 hypothetical protein CSB66_2973 [Enterobacter hormaechei]